MNSPLSITTITTDTMSGLGISEDKIQTNNFIEALQFAMENRAHVLVKPSRGRFYYIKGMNKTYDEIEQHLIQNRNVQYKQNSTSYLIKYE